MKLDQRQRVGMAVVAIVYLVGYALGRTAGRGVGARQTLEAMGNRVGSTGSRRS